MNEKKTENTGLVELSMQQILSALLHKSWLIGLVALVCAVVTFLGSFYLLTPMYQSSAMFYVNNNSISVGQASVNLTSGDISAARTLVDSYIVILKTRESLNDVIDYSGVDRSYGELKGMISAAAVDSTEIFEVVVTSEDPAEAEQIANAIAYILPKRISGIIEGSSAKVVDHAVLPASPSSPNYIKNTVVGFLLGLVLCAAIVLLYEMFDITIHTEEDITKVCSHPVLAAVPDMEGSSAKNSYYYSSENAKKNRKKSSGIAQKKTTELIGGGISFTAAEAYKLLRTKLQFSFVDEKNCYVIGVSSAMAGEGKSLTSINLAYSLAQLDKRVLLVDCDLRRPSISAKIPVNKVPGLSNYLTRQVQMEEIIQSYRAVEEDEPFDVISSGRNPPNPIELLSSARMSKAIDGLRDAYDYIILDLPPVGEVSDAMVTANIADGILLVVRQNYCNRVVLSSAVRQFEFVSARILGIVLNCTNDSGSRYGKKYKGYKRYHYYRSRYEGSYVAAAKTSRKAGADTAPEHSENQ